MKKNVKVVLAGPPGAGKGTASAKMQEVLKELGINFSLIETSSLLKKDKKFQSIIASGALVQDRDVIEAVLPVLNESASLSILDGFPRTEGQAKCVEEIQNTGKYNFIIVNIYADDKEIIKRVKSRRICPHCGKTYNLAEKTLIPKVTGICDKCKSTLITRPDDAKIEKRLQTYYAETDPAIKYLINKGFESIFVDSNKILNIDYVKEIVDDILDRIK